MYVIGLNGPPRSGKDTIATAIRNDNDIDLPVMLESLSRPMRKAAFALLGMDYSDRTYEVEKDWDQKLLANQNDNDYDSIRELMIGLSEKFVKPIYGQDFWARSVFESHLSDDPTLVVIPDIGFEAECAYIEEFVGEDNFLNVHLERPNCGWLNDSRRYVKTTHCLSVDNNRTPDHAKNEILNFIRNKMGWKI